jgi:microcompartment protein CcmL/EutN
MPANPIRAIGAIELSSVGIGYKIEDEMLKAGSVELLIARTICSGKYLIVLGILAAVSFGVSLGVSALLVAGPYVLLARGLMADNRIEKRTYRFAD